MLFKLIIQKYKPIHDGPIFEDGVRTKMKDLYYQHGVFTIGYWQNVDDPMEEYVLNVYQDENHYNAFTKKMKSNDFYNDLLQYIEKIRIWGKVISLRMDETSPILPDLVGVQQYIDTVKNLMDQHKSSMVI
ncbi:MAG: hypothetical protein ACW99Q_10495 [Candidatus Kariarchaeaceae archaeon]|jgi:hypothetical protein